MKSIRVIAKNCLERVTQKPKSSACASDPAPNASMVLNLDKCRNDDGSFNYAAYREIQQRGNREKIENVWVIEENVRFLADYIKRNVGSPEFGICHGTRRGKEQEWFRKYLECDVIGTEISDTATSFAHTIQWDFHDVKSEWINSCDFIYSNSFDHSYDPERCLNAWLQCVRQGGLCILEHTTGHGPAGASALDPFGADLEVMPYLVTLWGQGAFGVREIVVAPKTPPNIAQSHFIVIYKF